MNRLRWLITLPLAVVLVVFAVNNRNTVEVDLWPLGLVVDWPMFVYVFLGAGIGLLIGRIVRMDIRRGRHANWPANGAPACGSSSTDRDNAGTHGFRKRATPRTARLHCRTRPPLHAYRCRRVERDLDPRV